MLSGNLFSDLSLLRPFRSQATQSSTPAPGSGLPAAGSSYSLNSGNIKGTVALIDGHRVHYQERVKLFGGSQQLTLTDRQGHEVSFQVQRHHWVNTRA